MNKLISGLLLTVMMSGIFLLTGCASSEIEFFDDITIYFEKGKKALETKKYEKAIDQFTMVLLNSPGGELADDAQFYLAETYFKKQDYLLAISEYQQLARRYPYSPFVEESYYKIAVAYVENSPRYQLEQESTEKALVSLQEFVDSFPDSEFVPKAEKLITEVRDKLACKIYESGRLYRKLNEWESAIIYYDFLLNKYYDTPYAVKSKLEKARCLIRLRKFEEYEELRGKIEKQYEPETLENGLVVLDKVFQSEQDEIRKEEKKSRKRW